MSGSKFTLGPVSPEEKQGFIQLAATVGARYPVELVRLLGRNWDDKELQAVIERLVRSGK